MADRTPPQCPPVRRPDLVHPHRVLDVVHGTRQRLIEVRIALMHGANYNDPMHWRLGGDMGNEERTNLILSR